MQLQYFLEYLQQFSDQMRLICEETDNTIHFRSTSSSFYVPTQQVNHSHSIGMEICEVLHVFHQKQVLKACVCDISTVDKN